MSDLFPKMRLNEMRQEKTMRRSIHCAMIPGIVVLICAGCFAQGQQAGDPQQAQKPSLEDTETWIKQTFTDENAGSSDCEESDPDILGLNYGPYTSCRYSKYEQIRFAQCKVSFEIHHSTGGLGKGGFWHGAPDFKNDAIVSFSLRDIDPTTIKTSGLRGLYGDLKKKTFYKNEPWNVEVHFGTTNEDNKIEVEYPHGSTSGTPSKVHDCCEFGGGVTVRPEYAPRFVNALHNAVELCGGKPSTF
jgi:hypothetical protein